MAIYGSTAATVHPGCKPWQINQNDSKAKAMILNLEAEMLKFVKTAFSLLKAGLDAMLNDRLLPLKLKLAFWAKRACKHIPGV